MIEPQIGLVTVLYNGVEVLEGFFRSLSIQKYKNFILYVIDNSPDNKALDEAKRLNSEYKINSIFINNNDNLGVAKGNNQGIKAALKDKCEYVLLLNNDIEFNKNTISDMVHYSIESDEDILVPKIYYYGTNKLWMAGGHISKLKGTTLHRGDKEEDRGQYDRVEYINYAPTCFMLINKKIFNKVGFMDEGYFVYYDDTDFIYRLNHQGYKILYYPKNVIMHKVSFSTGGSASLFTVYYMHKNRIIFICKNLPFYYILTSFTYILVTRLVKMFFYQKKELSTVIKGIVDGMKIICHRKTILNKDES